MSVTLAAFVFLNAWWIVLFAVLPFFAKRDDAPATPYDYAAAPKPMPWRKILAIVTLCAMVITGLLAALLASGIIPLRDTIPSP